MTLLATVDPWDVEDGAVIRPIPDEPRSDGIVVAHDIDDHGDETYLLADGRSYWVRHDKTVDVVITSDVRADQVRYGDWIVWRGDIVQVADAPAKTLDGRRVSFNWQSVRTGAAGEPLFIGRSACIWWAAPMTLVRRPASGEAW